MLIALSASYLRLASYMYISSAVPIDPGSSGRQYSHIATERENDRRQEGKRRVGRSGMFLRKGMD